MKKISMGLLVLFALAVGVFLGICYATGSLPGSEVSLSHQAKYMQQLGELSWYIQSFNYEKPDLEMLYEGGARGMVYALDDIYAAYYTGEEFIEMTEEQSGRYVGIGVTIEPTENGEVRVVSIIDDSPAVRVGMRFDDILIALNGESLINQTADQISLAIKELGEVPFIITVRRGEKDIDFKLKSEEVISHRAHHEMREDIMWIQLESFTGDAVEGVQEALDAAKEQNAKGIIMDLRDNPGGDLEVVLDISDFFLDDALIMTMRTRTGKETVYKSHSGTSTDLPLAVLINGNSASASEVLAGALKDHGKAEVIGTQSFGKGIVQSIYPLQLSDGHVKLTTAAYFTPNGESIHEIGIEPDIVVELPAKYENMLVASVPVEDDTQLQAALTFLEGEDLAEETERQAA